MNQAALAALRDAEEMSRDIAAYSRWVGSLLKTTYIQHLQPVLLLIVGLRGIIR